MLGTATPHTRWLAPQQGSGWVVAGQHTATAALRQRWASHSRQQTRQRFMLKYALRNLRCNTTKIKFENLIEGNKGSFEINNCTQSMAKLYSTVYATLVKASSTDSFRFGAVSSPKGFAGIPYQITPIIFSSSGAPATFMISVGSMPKAPVIHFEPTPSSARDCIKFCAAQATVA